MRLPYGRGLISGFVGTHPSRCTGVPRSYERPPTQDPVVALCIGTYGDPRGMGVSHERGTPVGGYGSTLGTRGVRFEPLRRATTCRGADVHGSGFRVQGAGFRVQGSGFRVQGIRAIRDHPQALQRFLDHKEKPPPPLGPPYCPRYMVRGAGSGVRGVG